MTFNDIEFDKPGEKINPPKSTLISVVPFPISEFKPGLIPGNFDLSASEGDEPVCRCIGDSIHYVYIDHDRGSMRVVNPSYLVARSVVNDYNSSQLAASPACHPGFFWAVGEYTPDRVKAELTGRLEEAKQVQNNWFVELVKIADDDWEKTRQHYSISDIQRFAARALDPKNTRNRPWIVAQRVEDAVKMTLCPACGSDIPVNVVICRYCQFVLDQVRYDNMQFVKPNLIAGALEAAKRRTQ